MNIADFKKMSKTKRLQAMEALWDLLIYENGEIGTPNWHEKILKKRKNKISNGKAKFISLSVIQHVPSCPTWL